MNEIYDRLYRLGYSREFLHQVMPDWWTDEADADPACVLEGACHLSQGLGLSLLALLEPEMAGQLLRGDYRALSREEVELCVLDPAQI